VFKLQRANVITSIISFVFTATLLSACSKTAEISEEKNTYYQSADIQTISPSDFYQVSREYIGKVVSKQLASLSFEYGGKVESVYVDSGDLITKGQLLAEFNTDLLTIKLQEIDASIRQLNAQAELNRLNLERINKLNTKGYSSKQTLDELETEKKVIKADLSRQQANKSMVNYQTSKAQLHAPFDAVVSSRSVAEGEMFSPSQSAFELIKQAQHEISVGVPVKVARELSTGQLLEVELGQQKISAKILVVGKQVNQVSRTVELRLAITGKSAFYNGQLAKVEIKQRVTQAGFWLPLAALTDGIRGQWNIFQVDDVKDKLFTITATTIEVKYSTIDAVYITGLALTKHNIIVAGVHRYVPGQIVKKVSVSESQTVKAGDTL
jgi:RND family efflux transporter MFP subunit